MCNYFYQRKFDRDLLLIPAVYYQSEFPGLKVTAKWMNVHCCFHEDKFPSLGLHMISGGFHCFGCGAKGGDIVAFHMQRYGMSFIDTVTFFGAWIYEN
jgi:hypothetical protein